MVLERQSHQKPNRPHVGTVLLGLLRNRLPVLQRGSNRQRIWPGWCNGSYSLEPTYVGCPASNPPAKLDPTKLNTTAYQKLSIRLRNRFEAFGAQRVRFFGGRMAGAQGRGRRRSPVTSRRITLSSTGLGHWWKDCVGRASTLCEDSTCAKAAWPEESNNEGASNGWKRLLESYCDRVLSGKSRISDHRRKMLH